MESLIAELLEELTVELGVDDDSDEYAILQIKLKNAIREVTSAFNFKASHTDAFILSELKKHIGNIKDLTIYDFAILGAEGETSHNEKNVHRQYKDRKSCFSGIVRYAD